MTGMDEWQARENQRMREHQPGQDTASRLWRENEAMRTALQFIVDGYANQDVGHVEYRVKVYQVALAALGASKVPNNDHQ